MSFVPGSQGGCHVWLSVRTDGFAERRLNLAYRIDFADTGMPTQSRSSTRVRLRPGETPGACEFLGAYGYLIKPETLKDRPLTISVTLTDDEGRSATEEKTVLGRWPSTAPSEDPNLACGPPS